jgi:flagellar biogenesis protein FliO
MIGLYVQMALALAAVVGLIGLIAFAMKKRQASPGLLHVVAYQAFGQRKGIAAMRVGREILLVGVTPTDLKLMKVYDANEFEAESVRELNDKVQRLRDMKERLHEAH